MPRAFTPESPAVPRLCAVDGCMEEGVYPGPRRELSSHHTGHDAHPYYCKAHIQEINKSWDFFAGMSQSEIEAFTRDALVGHRPTKPSHLRVGRVRPETVDALWRQVERLRTGRASEAHMARPRLAKVTEDALHLLQLAYPYTAEQLKTRYRSLVKQHHPDRHHHDHKEKAEVMMKQIIAAYHHLREKLKVAS
jgi:DnaJ-domain-containing protein 1